MMKQIIKNFVLVFLTFGLSSSFAVSGFGQESKTADESDTAFETCLASANTPKPDVGFELARAKRDEPNFSCMISTSIVYQPELVYPLAAKAVKVSGAVNIDTVIDENGNVIWAKVTKGHPFLQMSALRTLCQTRFKPIVDENGFGLRVNGWMTYNFTLEK